MNRFQRLLKLNNLLKYPEGYSVIDLADMLDIGIRALRKDLHDIQQPPYNAVYWNEYRGKERLYRYKDINYSLPLFEEDDEIKAFLDNAINSIDSIREEDRTPQEEWLKMYLLAVKNGNTEGISDIMSFDNNVFFEGRGNLFPLIKAIKYKYPIKLKYQPYNKKEQNLNVYPYHLKQYNNRWFLIGKSEEKDNLQIYALDRIKDVKHLSKPYIETDIDFNDYFYDVIGVSVNDNPVERIELKIDKRRFPYIDTKPLHGSQEHLKDKDTDDFAYIYIKVKINNELITTLLSFGSDIEVLTPEHLRQIMREKIEKMQAKYKV